MAVKNIRTSIKDMIFMSIIMMFMIMLMTSCDTLTIVEDPYVQPQVIYVHPVPHSPYYYHRPHHRPYINPPLPPRHRPAHPKPNGYINNRPPQPHHNNRH